jgi:hypothetical protein
LHPPLLKADFVSSLGEVVCQSWPGHQCTPTSNVRAFRQAASGYIALALAHNDDPLGVTEEQIGNEASTDLAVWLFFQIAAGHIALPILTATFLFAKNVRKIPALIMVCVTWIISAICSTLL